MESKVRVYELAKDLNTTSKRLMEKLAEVNVIVKNHMSLLEDDQLAALYRHIGVVKHDEGKEVKKEEEIKRPVNQAPPKVEGKDAKKDTKSIPRIIRKTEIIIDSKNESRDDNRPVQKDMPKGDVRGDMHGNQRGFNRQDYMRTTNSTSGLRPGFIRDTKPEYRNETRNVARPDIRPEQPKETLKHDQMIETKKDAVQPHEAETKPSVSIEKNEDTKREAANLQPAEHKSEEKVEIKAEVKAEVEAEVKPDAKAETKKEQSQQNEDIAAPTEKPQGDRPQNDKPQYNRPQEGYNRPQGDRPQHDRPQGGYNRPQGDRPQYDRPQGGYNRPQGDRPQYDRPQGGYNRPQGDRPQYDRPQGDRPQGGYNRPQGDRPQYDKPQGGYNRPQGDRPQYDRPQGDRPQGGYNRPQGDRPQYDRPQGDRPQGGYNRPQGDRPQYDRPQGDRPQYGNRPQGDRPQYGNRPQGDRPQYGNRPQGDRPQYGNRPQGDRPQYGNRPQGDRPQYGNRPQGDRPQYGNRPQGDRPQGGYRQGAKSLDIPMPELSSAQKEELALKGETRREFQNKDIDRDVKRDQKRDVPKGQSATGRDRKFMPQKVVLGQKKGVSEVLSEEYILDQFYSDDGDPRAKKGTRPRRPGRNMAQAPYIPPRAVLTSITIPESLTVKDLAEALKKTSTEVIKKLMGLGVMATLNHELDYDTAAIISEEFGIKAEKQIVVSEEDILFDDNEEENPENMETRPPVVVVMGHVDHGKTSLLDAIRKANVTESEAGGITQHIGAYMVKLNNRYITFLDTPGHEAFTAMRARGAQVTDVAVLVVAADDGVMPQTIEAINHAKAANVSIIVAINKIDKPGANPDRVKQELTEYGIVAEEWGGDAIMVPVSAKKRENIDQLLEMILLAADVLELKANPNKQAKGTVIEAKLDKTRGPVATVLVQRGTLKVGDSVVTGTTVGRIRAMVDDKGHTVKEAGPSTPVEILGMPDVPEAGEIFYAITDEKVAKQLAEKRKFRQREQQLKSSARVTLDDLYTQIKEGKVKDLNIIVKADVQGSVQAVKQALEKLSNDEVRVNIIHGGVGAVIEADVSLAQVSNAIIIGFNVRPGANVAAMVEDSGVDMRLYKVIYSAIEDVQAAMKGLLEPTFKEVVQGHAEVRQVFKVSGVGSIGGGYVLDGKIIRNSDVRVIRSGIVVHEGKLASLKRFKDDVKEVAHGFECGLSVEKFNDIKEGDIIESYVMEEVAR